MPLKSWFALIAVFTAMCPLGCNRRGATPPPPSSTGLGSFTYNDTTAWYISRGGKVTVLVWIDSMIRGGAKETSPGQVRGQMTTWPGNKPLALEVKGGTMSLNGKDYVLAKGSLFLVYSRADPVRTVQLEHDLAGVEPTEAGLRQLANTDPDIMPFVKGALATQPSSQPAQSAVKSPE